MSILLKNPEISFPNQNPRPQTIEAAPRMECPPGIIAQYLVKTKFDDALKIVAHEKTVELLVANNAMCNSLRSSFLKLFIFP